jgi:hypothetical protein
MHRGIHGALAALIVVGLAAAPAGAQAPSGLTPDQQFLQALADNCRGVELLAHATLHRTGTFPSKTDAQKVDKQHDDEMDHIRAALKMLSDTYAPRASHADSATAAALTKQTGAAYDQAFRTDVVQIDQREIQLIDKYAPQLTNAQIKTMAQRLRVAAQAEIKQLGG